MRRDRTSEAVADWLAGVQRAELERRAARERADSELIKLYNSIPKRDLSFGRLRCSIPHSEFRELARRNPDLVARDKDTQTRAWNQLDRLGVLKHYRYQP